MTDSEMTLNHTQVSQADLASYDEAMSENISSRDISISRISIMQSNSPEVVDTEKPQYTIGQLIDNITRQILTSNDKYPWMIEKGVPEAELKAKPFMTFIPIIRLPNEYAYWTPKHELEIAKAKGEQVRRIQWKDIELTSRVRAGIWKADGGTWNEKGSPPVTISHNWYILPIDHKSGSALCSPLIVSFSRTSRQCNTAMTTAINSARAMRRLYPFQTVCYLFTKPKPYQTINGPTTIQLMDFAMSERLTAPVFCPESYQLCLQVAMLLSNKETGRESQLNILKFMSDEDDDQHETFVSHAEHGTAGSSTTVSGDELAEDDFPE